MDSPSTPLPRVTIEFCTQCKWLLRAAYVSAILKSQVPVPIPLSSGIPRVPHVMSMFQPWLAFLSPQSQNLRTGREGAREKTHSPYKSDTLGLECCILASYEFGSDFAATVRTRAPLYVLDFSRRGSVAAFSGGYFCRPAVHGCSSTVSR